MDTEGSHSGDGNRCGDGKRCRGEGMLGERSEQCLGEARLWLAPHS